MNYLYDKLVTYSKGQDYPFHMPGGKRSPQLAKYFPYLPHEIDITEIPGFDDLHHPENIILQMKERAAALYQSNTCHLLVNGSTAGILAAIYTCTEYGDEIIVAQNCHKSVYHAVQIKGLKAHFIAPSASLNEEIAGEITLDSVRAAIGEHPKAKALVITSPTYEGVVTDIAAIAQYVKGHEILLIVDEAHGAHLGFHPYLPPSACQNGADIVIQSLHKTLPSLTQTALLHSNLDRHFEMKLRAALAIFQSSSPSYILLASIDTCLELVEEKGDKFFEIYVALLKKYRKKIASLERVTLFYSDNYDFGKLVISIKDLTGVQLADILRIEYHIQVEMSMESYIVCMTSIMDDESGFRRLYEALKEISGRQLEGVLSKFFEQLNWEHLVDTVAEHYIYLYPPGIPIVRPGEIMTNAVLEKLERYQQLGYRIHGLE